MALQMFVFITSINIGLILLFPSLACQSDFTKVLNKKFSIRASFFLQFQSRNYLIPASLDFLLRGLVILQFGDFCKLCHFRYPARGQNLKNTNIFE